MVEPIKVSSKKHGRAIELLAEAFANDPMIKYVLSEKVRKYVNRIYGVMFKTYLEKGSAYFDSSEMNGIILWIDSKEDPGLGVWIRSGALKMLTFTWKITKSTL